MRLNVTAENGWENLWVDLEGRAWGLLELYIRHVFAESYPTLK